MGRKKTATEGNGETTVADKPVETKAERFRRLANKRLAKAVKVLNHVANLANRSSYEYTDVQVEIVQKTIAGAANRVIEAFAPRTAAAAEEQTFV